MVLIPLPFSVGLSEAILLFGVSLLIAYGPEYFPEIGSRLGNMYGRTKKR